MVPTPAMVRRKKKNTDKSRVNDCTAASLISGLRYCGSRSKWGRIYDLSARLCSLAHAVAAPHASFDGKTIGLLILGHFTAVRTQCP